MKTQTRYFWTAAILGAALAFAGCTSTRTTRGRAVGFRTIAVAPTLTVVESSSDRKLTDQDLNALRDAVMRYLAGEGLARSGEFYVRVDFPPEAPGQPAEWMVVKLTTAPANNYTLVAAYPAIGPDDYYPYGFAYNQGYDAFGYWNPPYSNYFDTGYVYPANFHPVPYPMYPHRRDDNKRDNHRPGDKNDDPRGANNRNDGRHDRDDGKGLPHNRPDNSHYTPRTDNNAGGTGHWNRPPRQPDSGGQREHGPRDSLPPRPESSGGFHSSPPPAPSYSAPAPAPSYSAPAPARDNRNDSAADRQQQAR